MESTNQIDTENQNLELNQDALYQVRQMRIWTNFLAIVGFIGIGIMIIAFIVMIVVQNANMYPATPAMSLIPALFVLIIYFFPIYFLYKFSSISKNALRYSDKIELADAFRYLKRHYMYIGILMIIIMSIYAVVLLFALFAGVFMGH